MERIRVFDYGSVRYESCRGEISLIKPHYVTMGSYEIFCIKGGLFEDIERYDTQEEVEKRIKELLCIKELIVKEIK